MNRIIILILSVFCTAALYGACSEEPHYPLPVDSPVEDPDGTDPDPDADPDPVPADDGILKILSIGNSFSDDALGQYLWELGDAAGVDMVIGIMYIGGSSLSQHLANTGTDAASYDYRKIVDGKYTSTPDQRLSMAIADEDWDYISFQEQSGLSGIYDSYASSLPHLVEWAKENATNPGVQIILHQTWAFPQSSGYSGFANYGNDQMTMFEAIVDAVDRAAELVDIDIIVPVGTAIQNGRTSYLGDTFNRDDRHLEKTYGRYTASCTWFEKLTGKDVTVNTYHPSTVSEYDAEIAQHAAHAAVAAPGKVTELTEYTSPPAVEDNDEPLVNPVYVDIGDPETDEPGWNNIVSVDVKNLQLKDSQGNDTGIFLDITKPFRNVNRSGPETISVEGWDMPASAYGDSFYGHLETFQNKVSGPAEITVRSLYKGQKYVFTFFSARDFGNSGTAAASANHETEFTVTGAETDSGEHLRLDARNNTDKAVTSRAIAPDENGNIVIGITAGPGNTRKEKMFFLNAMRIEPAAL